MTALEKQVQKQTNSAKKQWVRFFQAVLCGMFVVTLISTLYWGDGIQYGYDFLFHMVRLEGLAAALGGGAALPVRVYPLFLGGYGYAVGLFYPDLFLYPAAIARVLFFGPEGAFKFMILFYAAMLCVTSYLAARNITKSHLGGCTFMVLYGLCYYYFANIFVRIAVAEVCAMAFLPLAVWGLWDLTENGAKHPSILFFGFTGLLLSHTISLALMGLTAIVWVLVRLPRVLNKRAILGGLSAAGGCLAVSCYYWLPLLEQFLSGRFRVTESEGYHLTDFAHSWQTLLDPRKFESVGRGTFLIFVLTVIVGLLFRECRKCRAGWIFLGVSAVLTVCTVNWFPWALVEKTPLANMQFPWRLNALAQLFAALGAALFITKIRVKPVRLAAFAAAALLSVLNLVNISQVKDGRRHYDRDFFVSHPEETFNVSMGEWLPDKVHKHELEEEPRAQWTGPNGAEIGSYLPDTSFEFPFDGTPGVYTVPKIWYKGYSAKVQAENGESFRLPAVQGEGGRVQVDVPEGMPAGTIRVAYTGTLVQHIADWVSVLSVLALLAGAAVLFWKRKKRAV